MKNLSLIVAIAQNHAIGKDNKLLWHLSDDLKRFKRLTTGHTIVMGKLTFESLPVRPLPNRRSVVITDDPDDNFEGCVMASSIEDAIQKCDEERENFIIGGGSVYRQFMPFVNKIYLTRVYHDFEADTFLQLDLEGWNLKEKTDFEADEKNPYPSSFLVYTK